MNNAKEIKESFSSITVQDMRTEIDLGEVVLKDGPKAAHSTALWVIQQFFWDHPLHKEAAKNHFNLNGKQLQEILEHSKYMASHYMLTEWEGLGERATIYLMDDALHTGWHTSKYFNHKSLEELLVNILGEQDTKVGISTWSFMVRTLLPAATRYGIDANLLYGASAQVRKLRELIPTARKILSDPSTSDKIKEEYLRHFIEKAADPTVSHSKYKRETDEFRDRKKREVPKLIGYESIMPNGETWIVVRCATQLDETVVEMLLGSKVDLRVTDWRAFSVIIAKMMQEFGDLSKVDQQNLVPKMIHILEGRMNGTAETDGTEVQFTDSEAAVL